ncbi:MAG: (deoxy)nucleoside triphosphate pyrophosphohydrolase [Vicinamibacterales bacterium]|nr:(deoxy)nucleoside triphosphate pyrophosphohydrolase [Vicinamibacterales bacterium]MDP6608715.1 (deoxy)nucleoside triphosphate pyrophosphohydrolase [Vicinamibacterales bacterium]
MSEPSLLVVVAAVVERQGRFLVSQRAAGAHLGDYWEFPGGKQEPGESLTDALRREMREELDVEIDVDDELDCVEHAYADRIVRLHFFGCRLTGEPHPQLEQAVRWVTRRELRQLQFPPADAALVAKLTETAAP